MKTVGEILKQARKEKGIKREDVSRLTKINIGYLTAIEANDFANLPPSAFTKGFMQNYAKIVDLDPQTVLAIFRRDYDQDDKGRIIPRSLAEPVRPPKLGLNPSKISLIISVVIGLIIIGFFIKQMITFSSPPPLTVTSPTDGQTVPPSFIVTGTTQPQASLTVNNRPVSLDPDGNYSIELKLSPGEHTLIVTATSRNQKQQTVQVPITIAP